MSAEPALLAAEKPAPKPRSRLSRDGGIIFGAVILLFAAVYVLINLMIDISYAVFDPRIRY